MTKRDDCNEGGDRIVDVVGIALHDRVLQIGGKKMLFLNRYVKNEIEYVDRASNLADSHAARHVFDRIIVNTIDGDVDMDLLTSMNIGTITFFCPDPTVLRSMGDRLYVDWWPAGVWQMNIDTMGVMMTDASGRRRSYVDR